MMNTIVSSPPSAARSATVFTFQRATRTTAPAKSPFVTKTLENEPSRAYWAVTSVPQSNQPEMSSKPVEVNPLTRYPAWRDPEYRKAYLTASIEQGLAWQIRANRKARDLSQEELARLLGTQQSAVSRLEDPEYGAHSLDTLISIANVFDCALSVRFIPYSALARESEDLSPEALFAAPFSDEATKLEQL